MKSSPKSQYSTFYNGIPKEDVVLNANYDGYDLNVKTVDKLNHNTSYLQMNNDSILELLTHSESETDLINRLNKAIKIDKTKNKPPVMKRKSKLTRRRNHRQSKKSKKTRRKRRSLQSK